MIETEGVKLYFTLTIRMNGKELCPEKGFFRACRAKKTIFQKKRAQEKMDFAARFLRVAMHSIKSNPNENEKFFNKKNV